jgi:hypothetical protein
MRRTNRDLVTYATRFPPYVFSTSGLGLLVHRVARVALHWYGIDPEACYAWRRHTHPHGIAECVCGQSFHLHRAQLCAQPNPEALECGRCAGLGPIFGKHARETASRRVLLKTKRAAHRQLLR